MRTSRGLARRWALVQAARIGSLAGALSIATTGAGAPVVQGAGTTPDHPSSEAPLVDAEPTGTDWQLVGGLGAWAVGMGLVVTFNYAFFRLNDVVREDAMSSYRQGVPVGESSCERARAGVASTAAGAASPDEVAALCDEADTMEALRNLTLPIGLAAALLGVALIGTSDTVTGDDEPRESAGRWRLQVGGGAEGATAAVTVSFF